MLTKEVNILNIVGNKSDVPCDLSEKKPSTLKVKCVGEVFDSSSLHRRCSTSLTSASRQTVFIRADWQEKFTYVIKTGFTPAQQEKSAMFFF